MGIEDTGNRHHRVPMATTDAMTDELARLRELSEIAAQLEGSVKRYSHYTIMMATDGNELVQTPDGKFVLYDDFVAALAALTDPQGREA